MIPPVACAILLAAAACAGAAPPPPPPPAIPPTQPMDIEKRVQVITLWDSELGIDDDPLQTIRKFKRYAPPEERKVFVETSPCSAGEECPQLYEFNLIKVEPSRSRSRTGTGSGTGSRHSVHY